MPKRGWGGRRRDAIRCDSIGRVIERAAHAAGQDGLRTLGPAHSMTTAKFKEVPFRGVPSGLGRSGTRWEKKPLYRPSYCSPSFLGRALSSGCDRNFGNGACTMNCFNLMLKLSTLATSCAFVIALSSCRIKGETSSKEANWKRE